MPPASKNAADTPSGRRMKKVATNNQYFEVGKVGRKTGITLRDTGIRDEHGLEPVSGIFSSPTSPPQQRNTIDETAYQDDSIVSADRTLGIRRTPRLPPARQATPKHTNIGSPKRLSTARKSVRGQPVELRDEHHDQSSPNQLPPNRVLDFTGETRNRKSISIIDAQSPFRPRKALRRSNGPHANPFVDEPRRSSVARLSAHFVPGLDDEDTVEQSIEIHDDDRDAAPLAFDDGFDDMPAISAHNDVDISRINGSIGSSGARGRSRYRESDTYIQHSQSHHTPPPAVMTTPQSSRKRNRTSLQGTTDASRLEPDYRDEEATATQRKKGRTSGASSMTIHRDSGNEAIDPTLLAYDDQYLAQNGDGEATAESQLEVVEEPAPEPEPTKQRGRPKGKGKAAAPKERDPNRAMRRDTSPESYKPSSRGGSAGPTSNVQLRASTPFEDAGQQTSRYGRNLIQPLKYWENENRIWKNGEIEGIIRAEPVTKSRPKQKRRKKAARSRLDGIDEESDTESVMPDDWEEKLGVITGSVASWNPITRLGDPTKPVSEDLAFAAGSIALRGTADGEFQYAKIMTAPMIGAGLVVLPPSGFKRAKNSRKMHLVFFVHEGKVDVEISAAGLEVNDFTLTKGGAWIVPRGNNYAITNCSSTKSATCFFAQGWITSSGGAAATTTAGDDES